MPRTIQGNYVTESAKVFQDGDDFWHKGAYDEARRSYQEAACLYRQDQDLEGEAFVLTRLGELELSLDKYEAASAAFLGAMELVKGQEDMANTYGDILIKFSKLRTAEANNQGLLADSQFKTALMIVKEAQEVLEHTGNRDLLGEAYDHQAYIFLMLGQEADALKAYRTAADLFEKEGITLKEASVLRAMARLEMKNKNYDVAHDILEKCRDLYRENGDLLGEASTLSAIGCLRYIIRDIENARKALMKSVYLYGKAAHHFAEAEALLYLARVESCNLEQGDYNRAKIHYKQSIELYDFLGNELMKNAVQEEYQKFLDRIKSEGIK